MKLFGRILKCLLPTKFDSLTDPHNDPYREACHEIACRWPVPSSWLWKQTHSFIPYMGLSVAQYQRRAEMALKIWWHTDGKFSMDFLMLNIRFYEQEEEIV